MNIISYLLQPDLESKIMTDVVNVHNKDIFYRKKKKKIQLKVKYSKRGESDYKQCFQREVEMTFWSNGIYQCFQQRYPKFKPPSPTKNLSKKKNCKCRDSGQDIFTFKEK